MPADLKRKANGDPSDPSSKKQKAQGPKQWRVIRKGQPEVRTQIEAGDEGIWVTCDRGAEAKCTAELRDLFNEYAQKLYGEGGSGGMGDGDEDASDDGDTEVDIEADISRELTDMKQSSRKPLFQPVRIDVKCVLFFKTRAPIVPVEFIHRICLDAQQGILPRRARFIKRLTPVVRMGKATDKGLEDVSKEVLRPDFHGPDVVAKKFAIRPTIRNHNLLKRDDVIKQVADAVGSKHSVDLGNYDRCILVEIYKNVCGMSVVGADFEILKRFNLAEIWREVLGEINDDGEGKSNGKGKVRGVGKDGALHPDPKASNEEETNNQGRRA